MKVIPFGQVDGETRVPGAAEERFKGVELFVPAPHLTFEQSADVGTHALASL
ncbi:MAG: hypothetical protein HOO99_06945, partial [Hyphomicrobiaceae bacterium]|nr:hypothetical protein [Hyphomicrobiaceae bacterium]